ENHLKNFNAFNNSEKTTELTLRLNMLLQENLANLTQIESPFLKKDNSDTDFETQVKNHLIDIAPRLSQHDYISKMQKLDQKNLGVAVFTSENGSSYGFDTAYLVWKDRRGRMRHRELKNTRENKDYVSINKVSQTNSSLSIQLGSGGSYSGNSWNNDFDIPLSSLGLLQTGNIGESIRNQIEKMFPSKNAQALESILFDLDEKVTNIEKAADNTYTGFVLSFEIDGKKIYAKGSNDTSNLLKEVNFYKAAWEHNLMRPITPKLLGYGEEDGIGVILTYGTENENIVSQEDIKKYIKTRTTILAQYAQRHNISLERLLSDTNTIDVFNRAVSHTFTKDQINNPVYEENKSSIIVPFPMLLERASKSNEKEYLNFLKKQEEVYHRATLEYYESDVLSGDEALLCFDGRPENIFKETSNNLLRPIGDLGFARVGPTAFDIARLESANDKAYTSLYVFARNKLEQMKGNNFELGSSQLKSMENGVLPLSYINLVRTISSKLSRSSFQDASRYKNLITQHQYLK
ncbi:MAG: hypothetical protein KC550_06905, partial [Nanoarchaeota archaeon]|nr:hypothetical protein [Nanoarchaeota archaeon]